MVVKRKIKQQRLKVVKPSQSIAIVGLLINVLVLPGLGSLIGGKTTPGILQLIFFIISIILDVTIIGLIIGIPLGIAMWIWGLVTGIGLIKEAE